MKSGLKNIAIDTELQNIGRFFLIGIAEMKKISAPYDFYHGPFMFFASGFERLFKVCLCLDYLRKNSSHLEDHTKLWSQKKGHDLVFLKDSLIDNLNLRESYIFTSDANYFIKNDIFKKIIKTLSEYGNRGRYFDLDQIFGKTQSYNINEEWNELEHYVLKKSFGMNYLNKYVNDPNQLFVDSRNLIIENISRGLNYVHYLFEKGALKEFYIYYGHHLIILKNIDTLA